MRTSRCLFLLLSTWLSGACGESPTPTSDSNLVPGRDGPATTAGSANALAPEPTETRGSGASGNASGGSGSGNAAGGSGGNAAGGSSGSGNPGEPKLWAQKRAALLEKIGRPTVALDVEESPQGQDAGLLLENFSIQTDESTRIHGTSYRPGDAGPYPAVIYLHGTGGDRNADNAFNRNLARRGFFVVTIDARYHGQGRGTTAYFDAIFAAYVSGDANPFLYDTVWDVMRLIDYLEQRPDVDSERVGLVGSSKGGMETYLTAAVEPRVDVAVPWIGVQSWAWALDNGQWQPRVASIQGAVDRAAQHDGVASIDVDYVRRFYDRAVPGIYGEFDATEMLPAIAPRPLLVVNGDSDPKTPLPALRLIETTTKQAYVAAAATENFVLRIQPNTGHSVTEASLAATLDWFVAHLKP